MFTLAGWEGVYWGSPAWATHLHRVRDQGARCLVHWVLHSAGGQEAGHSAVEEKQTGIYVALAGHLTHILLDTFVHVCPCVVRKQEKQYIHVHVLYSIDWLHCKTPSKTKPLLSKRCLEPAISSLLSSQSWWKCLHRCFHPLDWFFSAWHSSHTL